MSWKSANHCRHFQAALSHSPSLSLLAIPFFIFACKMKVKNAIIKSRLTEQHPINLATRGGGGFCQIHKGSAQCYINYQTNIGIIPTD